MKRSRPPSRTRSRSRSRSRSLNVRALAALAVLAAAVAIALTMPVRLGLDLRGGTQIVLETKSTDTTKADREATDRTVEVLRGRIDALGVAEPTIVRSGENRVVVELPGVQDPKKAADVLGRTAQLTVHSVLGPAEDAGDGAGGKDEKASGADGERVLPDESGQSLRLKAASLTGQDVKGADARFDQQGGAGWHVTVDFKDAGSDRWARVTGEAACNPAGDVKRRVAIVLDNKIISSPQVDPSVSCGAGITGGSTQITGQFDDAEARELALLVKGGALPVPVETIEQRTIGATLGDEAISAGAWAAVIGTALTALFIIVVYRLMGALATVALLCYGLISYAALAAVGATLTLPGLAGFVLAIGMAVDANVLVFERAREEQAARTRPSTRSALTAGFRSAFSAIADSNITTLIAAALLFFLASGPVKGFGVTLGIGVLASMVSALVITRVLAEFAASRPAVFRRPRITGISSTGPVRDALLRRDPFLMRRPRRWLAASLVVLVVAGSGILVRGLNFGIEFTGGRLIEYSTATQVDPDRARDALADAGFPRAVVQSSGDGDLTVRTEELTDAEAVTVTKAVAALGGETEKVRDELIGPSLGEELRRDALIALGLALAAQLAYLAARFRLLFGTARGRRARPRRGDPGGCLRLAGQADRRGVPGRAADRDRLLGQRLGGPLRPRPGTAGQGTEDAVRPAHQRRDPADPAAHGQHRHGRGAHPRLAGDPGRRLTHRLRARPADRRGSRHVLLGVHRLPPGHRTARPRHRAPQGPQEPRPGEARTTRQTAPHTPPGTTGGPVTTGAAPGQAAL
ncbi:SecD/SecF fusion protein [Streptomyces ambofaciens]